MPARGAADSTACMCRMQIDDNNAWIANFESNKSDGAFEAQYKKLLSDIQEIYGTAKEFHGKGIDLLIKVGRGAGGPRPLVVLCRRRAHAWGQRRATAARGGHAAVNVPAQAPASGMRAMCVCSSSAHPCHCLGPCRAPIQEFDYHLAFKRWSDTFTAVPFKPK